MDTHFKPGDQIHGQTGAIEIVKWLAEGGQGDVYIVQQGGIQKALKWYKPGGMGKDPKAFYENIKSNYFKGTPDSKRFLWPEDITEWKEGTFGYVMKLRPEGYHEIGDYLLTRVRFSSVQTIIDAALNIVSAYRMLHNDGYCYQDLNDGNFFIHPQTGSVLICDNDNVAPEGTNTGILGKPGYIAPEIILQKQLPDTYSDRFSMSIIIFMLFCLTRPLEGKRTFGDTPRTEGLMRRVYGSDPHFIMENPSHPEYGVDNNVQRNAITFWSALPSYMKDLFLSAFSRESIEHSGKRPTELNWIQTLVRLRSEILRCRCGADVLTENGASTVCSKCASKLSVPFILSFSNNQYSIPSLPGSRIYRCQIGPCNADDALKPVGKVLAKQSDISVLGLRNLTDKHWNAETPSGKSRKVMPREVVPMKKGIKISIETETITIDES